MEQKMERLLYIYKRGLVMLSSVTEKEVQETLGKSLEEYMQGVAKKHLEIGEKIENQLKEMSSHDDKTFFDSIVEEFTKEFQPERK